MPAWRRNREEAQRTGRAPVICGMGGASSPGGPASKPVPTPTRGNGPLRHTGRTASRWPPPRRNFPGGPKRVPRKPLQRGPTKSSPGTPLTRLIEEIHQDVGIRSRPGPGDSSCLWASDGRLNASPSCSNFSLHPRPDVEQVGCPEGPGGSGLFPGTSSASSGQKR